MPSATAVGESASCCEAMQHAQLHLRGTQHKRKAKDVGLLPHQNSWTSNSKHTVPNSLEQFYPHTRVRLHPMPTALPLAQGGMQNSPVPRTPLLPPWEITSPTMLF